MKIEFSDEEVKEIVRLFIECRYFINRDVPKISIEGSVWSIRANLSEPELTEEVQF